MKNGLTSLLKLAATLLVLLSAPRLMAVDQYEVITIPEMQFPLGMNEDASIVVGTGGGAALIWQAGKGLTVLGEGCCWGVSDDGKVTGELKNADGLLEAFIWQNGNITFLGNLPTGAPCDGFLSSGLDISRDGSTVVGMGWLANWEVEGFYKKTNQPMVGLGQDGGFSSKAQAVNADGTFFGGWNESSFGPRSSAVWNSAGQITYLGSFDPQSSTGEVLGMNAAGTKVIGGCMGHLTGPVLTDEEAYIWTPAGGLFGLGVPPNNNFMKRSLAFEISDNDEVIGQYTYAGFTDSRAAIYTPQLGKMVDLREYFNQIGLPVLSDWILFKGHLISRNGKVIAGTGLSSEAPMGGTFIVKLSNPGLISGHVTLNGGLGNVTNAVIEIGGKRVHPDANGNFNVQVLAGLHQAKAAMFGYNSSATVSNISVTANQTTGDIELVLTPVAEPINQIRNLTVNTGNGLTSWSAPLAGNDSYLAYDNGINTNGFGVSADYNSFTIACRWPVAAAQNYSGAKINTIRFFPRNSTCTYTVKIWSGSNFDSLVYEKLVTQIVPNQWNEVTVDQSVFIDGARELFIGVEIGQCQYATPAGYSATPGVLECSDWIKIGNNWESLSYNYGMEVNWNLQALLTDAQGNTISMERPKVKAAFKPNMIAEKDNPFARFDKPFKSGIKEQPKHKFITCGSSGENKGDVRPVQSYKVYLNNQVVASGVSATEYQLSGLTPNTTYTAGVKAVYANGSESEVVNHSFIYQKASAHLNPVELNVNSSNVVSWGMPGNWFDFCGDTSEDAIGDPAGDFAAAIRFTPDQLADYTNTKISKISFYPRSAATTYTLKIWNGNDGETELYSQPITNITVNQWNEVTLTTPQVIDVTKDLYVGYLVSNQMPDSNSAGADAGPGVIGHGGMVKMTGYSWANLADWGLDKNWNLRAFIEVQSGKIAELKVTSNGNEAVKPAKKSTLVNSNIASKSGSKAQNLTGYNVYLNNLTTPIATVTGNSYQLTNLGATNTVGIQAVYNDGVSEIVTKSFTGINGGLLPAVTELKGNYPNPFNPATSINFSVAKAENIKISVYNVSGQIVKELLNSKMAAGNYQVNFDASAYNSGIYYAVMESAAGVKMTKKMVLLK